MKCFRRSALCPSTTLDCQDPNPREYISESRTKWVVENLWSFRVLEVVRERAGVPALRDTFLGWWCKWVHFFLYTELVEVLLSLSKYQFQMNRRNPDGLSKSLIQTKKVNEITTWVKAKTTSEILKHVQHDRFIWWTQNDVLYTLKIQSSNQNICYIKDGSRLYAAIRNEEAQVESEAYPMKLREWVVRSNFLIQTWFFGSFFIKKKWTEETPMSSANL